MPKRDTQRPCHTEKRALIPAEEVIDDWMVDDIRQQPPRAKRKRANVDSFLSGNTLRVQNKSRRTPEINNRKPQSVSQNLLCDELSSGSENEVNLSSNVRNDDRIEEYIEEKDDDERVSPITQEHHPQKKLKSKQLKLTNFTTRDSTEFDNHEGMLGVTGMNETENIALPLVASVPAIATGVRRIRVKIKEQTIMVPVTSATG